MGNGRIFATRLGPDKPKPNTIVCPRCGFTRASGGKKGSRSKLCRSCNSILSEAEKELWRK